MLTNEEVSRLLDVPKLIDSPGRIALPLPGEYAKWEAKSLDHREVFVIDANRKGKLKLGKCTFQERYQLVEILLRLDIDGPPHQNPDGEVIDCPHLHIYRERWGAKWAYPLPADFTDTTDLVKTFQEFLRYCGIQNIPDVQRVIT